MKEIFPMAVSSTNSQQIPAKGSLGIINDILIINKIINKLCVVFR